MAPVVRVGLVGVGDIAAAHADAALAAGLDLRIAAGRSPARAGALADRLGVPLYATYDALLDDPTVEAVDLCVPTDLHRPYAERAFAAGKHVLCEKPIALSLPDADAMIAAAARARRILMVGHVLRFWSEYRQLRTLLADTIVAGGCWLAMRRLTALRAATTGAQGWRDDPARSGGAALDLQVHDADIICSLFGPPATVFAQGLRSSSGAWDYVHTLLGYPDGPRASIEATVLLQDGPSDMSFQLTCPDHTVSYRYEPQGFSVGGLRQHAGGPARSGPSLVERRAGAAPRGLYTPTRDSFAAALEAELAAFGRAVASGEPPADGTGGQARRALAVCLASLRACETGEVQHGPF
jgi:predicted dehydrogenase